MNSVDGEIALGLGQTEHRTSLKAIWRLAMLRICLGVSSCAIGIYIIVCVTWLFPFGFGLWGAAVSCFHSNTETTSDVIVLFVLEDFNLLEVAF